MPKSKYFVAETITVVLSKRNIFPWGHVTGAPWVSPQSASAIVYELLVAYGIIPKFKCIYFNFYINSKPQARMSCIVKIYTKLGLA